MHWPNNEVFTEVAKSHYFPNQVSQLCKRALEGEIKSEYLWDEPEYERLKTELLLKYVWAELGKEPLPMPRIHHA
ncbi:hypothetical protein GCM10010912_13220 [Paenibacillus albidus]|uniref:Uncharacterized protein n=1 Tax=Paenibacillus albidus TaxID=2041023 RepID=A0A917C340_9BACL|nr:hypothetical protein GCM10010912_13220 [Paenibacillus albidus]